MTLLCDLPKRMHVYATQQAAQQAFAASTPAPTVPFLHRHNERDPAASAENGYYLLSAHFKWALTRVFSGRETALPAKVQRVIILEEDLKIAPDFFNFFASMVRFVDTDPTLLVSQPAPRRAAPPVQSFPLTDRCALSFPFPDRRRRRGTTTGCRAWSATPTPCTARTSSPAWGG